MRILGLDWGSSSVKAVEIDSAFGRFEVHEYHEQKIIPGENPPDAVARLLNSLAKEPDKIIVALKTGQVTFRNLKLPTRDKKAIDAGVRFELEDDLPFAIEDAAFDYSVLSQAKQVSSVHAAATLRTQLLGAVEAWKTGGADPDLVSTEAWSYRCFFNRVLQPEQKTLPIMLVQVGHERTILYVHHGDAPIICREISWGGHDLTLAICKKYGVPIDQAEHAKLDHGFVIPQNRGQQGDATVEQIEFSDTLMEPIRLLISDIRQAELTCKSLTNESIDTIYLAGGTSLLPGLNRVIEETLRVPVKYVQSLSSLSASGSSSGVTYNEETDSKFLLSAALAVSMVGDRGSMINFRKGSLGKEARSRQIGFETLKGPLTAVAAIVVCFFASIWVQSAHYQSRIKDTNTALERSVRGFFGQLSNSAVKTYLSNTKTLKTQINKELDKRRELARLSAPNPHNPLGFLNSLSQAVPRDIVVDMTEFQVGAAPTLSFLYPKADQEAQASLTFLLQDPNSAERLGSILGGKMSALDKGRPEETTTADGQKRWRVTYKGKPNEDSYGK